LTTNLWQYHFFGFIKTVRSSFIRLSFKSSTSTLHSLAAVRELHVASKVSLVIMISEKEASSSLNQKTNAAF